ncbi:cache domain-containing sensor histidine kinase [Paenibacillus hamazuiensis]|uniref:cache domain-containing sensor histidine kinase n=1 Tax=Paenibacillus hamazuiensis TaxID=2936508 RepID=UPI0020101A02|nr:sensor histidine kinase [Paenibacillus hamazuiensis]
MRQFLPFRFQSIHSHIAIAFSFLILCTTVILSFNAYRLSSDAVTENSLEYSAELMKQVGMNIQTYIGNMESIASLASGNGDLKRYMSLDDPGSPEGTGLAAQLTGYFHSIVASRSDIASMVFVSTNGGAISSRTDVQLRPIPELVGQDWYRKAQLSGGRIAISPSHVQHVFQNEYRWVVSLSVYLENSPGISGGGVLLVDLNYKVINDLCTQIQLGKRGYVFIVDPGGDLIYHPQQQIIYSKLKSEDIPAVLRAEGGSATAVEGDRSKLYTVGTTSFGWKIAGVIYPEELARNKRAMQLSSATWGLVCLIIALGLSFIFSFTLTRPLKNLEEHMKQVERGNFDIRVDIENTNEIGKVARTFNLMIGKIRELMEQIVQEQKMKRISELKALQAQIHPHFLYNTLDSIIWMAETGKMGEVVTMTSALSKLLRSSISKGEELVPLSAELEHVRNYLTIQQIRYRSKFTYSIEVNPDMQECLILKIVLQPLVENAIYHGIKNKAEPGRIRIVGKRTNGALELKIVDDGVGMAPEQAAAMLTGVAGDRGTEKRAGVGVRNVNHRVQLYFGESYGLSFESELDEGTTVTLRIPELHREVSRDG